VGEDKGGLSMHSIIDAFQFIGDNLHFMLTKTLEHLALSGAAIAVSLIIAIPLGVTLGHQHRGSFLAINASNIGRALPSLAIISIGIGILGIGFINVMVGCAVGFGMLLFGSQSHWMLPFALALTVLISSYVIRVKTMWRQAPITAAIVIAAGLAQGAKAAGIESGMHKVAEVIFGCMVGLVVSWLMSKVWLVKPPVEAAELAEPQVTEAKPVAELKV